MTIPHVLDQATLEPLGSYADQYEGWHTSLCKHLIQDAVPAYMWDGIYRYVMLGHPVGDFLTALFNNDFLDVFCRADLCNQSALKNYAQLMLHVPSDCKGSINITTRWRHEGGLYGRYKTQADKELKEADNAER